jgi:hypothetical protein
MLIVIILLLFIFFAFILFETAGSGGDPIIISFKPLSLGEEKPAARFILEKENYTEPEFRKILETLLLTVFGRWSLNFAYSGSGSRLYCEGLLSSIFANKPQFKVVNTNAAHPDFILGLSKNIDSDLYLGFECADPLGEHEKSGAVSGLLNFDWDNELAFLYLAKFFGHYYETEDKIYVPYWDKYVKVKLDEERENPVYDYKNFYFNGSDEVPYAFRCLEEGYSISEKYAGDKITVSNDFYEIIPMCGEFCKNGIKYRAGMENYKKSPEISKKANGKLIITILDGDKESAGILIGKINSCISYDSLTVKEYEGKGYNSMLRILLNRMMLGKKVCLRTFSINPVSDHILGKIGVERRPQFSEILKKTGYDEMPRGKEKSEIYKKKAFEIGEWTHEKDYSATAFL